MTDKLAVNGHLGEAGITSRSGQWALRYGADGCARLVGRDGQVRWVAGGEAASGLLKLKQNGDLVVFRDSPPLLQDGQVIGYRDGEAV